MLIFSLYASESLRDFYLLFTLYGWRDLKLRYCLVKVGLGYTNGFNLLSARFFSTSRKVR